MRISLNLLPEEERVNIRRRNQVRFFMWQGGYLLLLEILFLVILTGIYFMLDYRLRLMRDAAAGENFTEEVEQLQTYEEKFKEANRMADTMIRLDRANFIWTKPLTVLEESYNEGIIIESLSTTEYTLVLSGRAATRADFLEFRDALEKKECVENIANPITNLLAQEDVEFQLDLQFKKECVRNP